MNEKPTRATLARAAGNLLSGVPLRWLHGGSDRRAAIMAAVETAREIVAEIDRTEPKPEDGND